MGGKDDTEMCQACEELVEVGDMLVERSGKRDEVIDEDFDEVSEVVFHLTLDISHTVTVAHHDDVVKFLAAMGDYCEAMPMGRPDSPLVEESGCINYGDVRAVGHEVNDV